MVPYYASQETTHFVNWVLHSGKVALDVLMRKARTLAREEGEDHTEALALALGVLLAEQSVEFCPGYNPTDQSMWETPPERYAGSDAFYLFAPIFSKAINQIDLETADHLIRAHVNKAA